MSKRKITNTILQKSRHVNQYVETKRFTWGEVKKILKEAKIQLEDDDIITLSFQEEEQSHEDAYTPARYIFSVERTREETDEEEKKRLAFIEKRKQEQLARDKELYLKLKKKFENETV